MSKEKEKKNWEEEFDKQFDHYNPIHDDGIKIPVWTGSDYQAIKDFIRQLLKKENQKFEEEIIKILEEFKEKKQTRR